MEYQLPPITRTGRVAKYHLEDDGTLDYGCSDGSGNASVRCSPKYNRTTKKTTFHHITVDVISGFVGCNPADIADALLRDVIVK